MRLYVPEEMWEKRIAGKDPVHLWSVYANKAMFYDLDPWLVWLFASEAAMYGKLIFRYDEEED